jgi:hypothetical protein
LFVCVDLCAAGTENAAQTTVNNALAGTSVSSLYRLKDIDNSGMFLVSVTNDRWRLLCIWRFIRQNRRTISSSFLPLRSPKVGPSVIMLICD